MNNMNPCLITYSDSNMADYTAVTQETAAYFASGSGIDFLPITGSVAPKAHLKKIELALAELNNGRSYVAWADSDIVFRKDFDRNFIPTYSQYSMSVLTTVVGHETSFVIVNNTDQVKQALTLWLEYGNRNQSAIEEGGFYPLFHENKWVRDMVVPIPSTTTITNPFEQGHETIGKHFYASSSKMFFFQMVQYKKWVFGGI